MGREDQGRVELETCQAIITSIVLADAPKKGMGSTLRLRLLPPYTVCAPLKDKIMSSGSPDRSSASFTTKQSSLKRGQQVEHANA